MGKKYKYKYKYRYKVNLDIVYASGVRDVRNVKQDRTRQNKTKKLGGAPTKELWS